MACKRHRNDEKLGWVAVIVVVEYPGPDGGQRVSGDVMRGDISSLILITSYYRSSFLGLAL